MLQSIWDDVRREFSFGNMINKIIIVNVAVFLVINIIYVVLQLANGWPSGGTALYQDIVHFFSVGDNWWHMLTHPWTLLTYMFLHEGFFHILWNMLFLFWFGRIFGDLLGDQRVLPLYIAGGLAGFIAFFIAFNLTSLGTGSSYALGASAAVLCILTATGIFAPEYGVRLFILGTVRLKYIVFFAIMVDVFALGSLGNIGGTIAHLGGIVFGFLYVFYLRRGTDLTAPVSKAIDWVQNTWHALQQPSKEHQRSGPRAAYRSGRPVGETKAKARPSFMRKAGGKGKPKSDDAAAPQRSHQEQLDEILDKIKERGYNSLTKEEKDFLFRASNQ